MKNINLLDWRRKQKMIQNNRFFVVIGAVVVCSGLLTVSSDLVILYKLSAGQKNIELLNNEMKLLEEDIKTISSIEKQKTSILEKRGVIEKLQKRRSFMVKVWNDIARSVPEGVVLDEMSTKDDQILLTGVGFSNATIAELMKNVQSLDWVSNAKLGEIKTSVNKGNEEGVAGPSTIDFRLTLTINPDEGISNEDKSRGN